MTSEGFHEDVVAAVETLNKCTRIASLRTCLYNRYMHYILPVSPYSSYSTFKILAIMVYVQRHV